MKVAGYLLLILGAAFIFGAVAAIPGIVDWHFIVIGLGFVVTGVCVILQFRAALLVYGLTLVYIYIMAILVYLDNAELGGMITSIGMPTIIGIYLFANKGKIARGKES